MTRLWLTYLRTTYIFFNEFKEYQDFLKMDGQPATMVLLRNVFKESLQWELYSH